MKNGQIWQDADGNDIQAHGGCIIKHGDTYYWYGEHKGGENKITLFVSGQEVSRVDVIGISCYTSKDLVNGNTRDLCLKVIRTILQALFTPHRLLSARRLYIMKK